MMKEVELYTGQEIYRPFWERDSALLEVTMGCSWHRCKFCDFANDSFSVIPLSEVEVKARRLAEISKEKERLFLLGENPFVLKTSHLLSVIDIARQYMPQIKEVSMYARVDDILRKSMEEIRILRKSGVVHLHIGLESGNDEVLKLMDKGITSDEVRKACVALHMNGITYSFTLITGLGGKRLSNQHIHDTAELLNDVQPSAIWCIGLRVWKTTPLYQMCKDGEFDEVSVKDRLWETHRLVKELEQRDAAFVDTTILDRYSVLGHLPEQKQGILQMIEELAEKNQNRI